MPEHEMKADPPYLELVGKVAASWAVLDINLDVTISLLTGWNTLESACVTAQFSSHYPKLKAIIALCELKGASKQSIKDLRKFSGSLTDLTERRNRAIHDGWITYQGKLVGRFNLKSFGARDDDPANELRSLLDAINRRIESFRKLRTAILNEIRSQPPAVTSQESVT